MIKLKRILVATDFSNCALQAKNTAHELCAGFGAELHLLHVIHNLAIEVPESGMEMAFPGFLENIGGRRKELRQIALQSLNAEVAASWHEQHVVVLDTRLGKPFVEIVRYAEENDIDLIVVGTHGRTGLEHMLLGSVAENVVRKAPCPVLTVHPPVKKPEKEPDFPVGIHPLPVGD